MGMVSAFVTLNLPLSIVYVYHPESRHWMLMTILAVPGLILPAMSAMTRLFRERVGLAVMAATCTMGATLAAIANHLVVTALTHIGIYLGDRVGTTRLPTALQADLSFWKKHFAEHPGYWLPNAKDVFDLILLFGLVAAITAGWLIARQRLAPEATPHPPHSLKMPV